MPKYLDNDDHPISGPRMPESAEEWDLKLEATEAAARTDVPEDVRQLIKALLAEISAREAWLSPKT